MNEDDLLKFTHESPFQHPSYNSFRGKSLQGVKARSSPHLIKLFQYDFPDTAEFGASFLDETSDVVESMEQYSKMILLLFVPY